MGDPVVFRGTVLWVHDGKCHVFTVLKDKSSAIYHVDQELLARYGVGEGDSFIIFEKMAVLYLFRVARLNLSLREMDMVYENASQTISLPELQTFRRIARRDTAEDVAQEVVDLLLPASLLDRAEQIANAAATPSRGEDGEVIH